jgi:hypothetical protein
MNDQSEAYVAEVRQTFDGWLIELRKELGNALNRKVAEELEKAEAACQASNERAIAHYKKRLKTAETMKDVPGMYQRYLTSNESELKASFEHNKSIFLAFTKQTEEIIRGAR